MFAAASALLALSPSQSVVFSHLSLIDMGLDKNTRSRFNEVKQQASAFSTVKV